MINSLKFIFIFSAMSIIIGCTNWSEDQNKFVDAYRDVLAIRIMQNDTAIANPNVRKILRRYGYTKETFRQAYENYSTDRATFRAMIDSAQIRAKRDIQKISKRIQKYAE